MTKYKQSWLRLPTEYDDVKVEVSAEGPHVCCCATSAAPPPFGHLFAFDKLMRTAFTAIT